MIKRKIVAIGGGELNLLQTEVIDKRIIELTGKKNPKALFIPTASGDAEGYIDNFHKCYGQHFGCQTNTLNLIQDPPTLETITELVLNSDLIYVGGGNTYRMMKIWRRMQLDSILSEAASRGIVLSGLSAGAICWFRYGHSDSRSFSSNSEWDYIRVSGLGLINLTFCPHYHVEKRETSFANMIARKGGIGIACDNNAAIEIIGDKYRILTSISTAKAYKLFKHKGDTVISELQPQTDYSPLSKLLARGKSD
ncbi:peptidase E [Candidatus Poribacteria bacterium]|nr:MAG: peptidase E [Candidatus Poribacteria bacterium]